MLAKEMVAPKLAAMVQPGCNGLWHRGPARALLRRLKDRQAHQIKSSYEHQPPQACFIQGSMTLVKRRHHGPLGA